MKKLIAVLAAFAVGFLPLLGQAAEEQRASKAEAEALVKKAVAYYQKNGKDKALAEFQKSPGPFVDRDLYVTVYTMDGTALSHINPKMVGKNMMDLRDPNGKYHIKERLESAKTKDKGWQDFSFFNPMTKKVEPKEMYWEKHDNMVFAAGAYKAQ